MLSILITLLCGYGLIFVTAMFFADRLIFQPHPSSYADDARIIKIRTGENTLISAIYLPNPNASYTILYSHGNGEDLGDLSDLLLQFRERGYSIIAYDYSGYGTSEGTPSEHAAYADINAVYDHTVRRLAVRPEKILVLGRSVGGGPSVDLASRRRVGGLILESSFQSAFRVALRIPLLPFDKFDSIGKIGNVACPVLVIHGTRDGIIPFRHGERLFGQASGPKMSYWVEGSGHNDLLATAGEEYWKVLEKFVAMVDVPKP